MEQLFEKSLGEHPALAAWLDPDPEMFLVG
jgi:hypothetical protein